MAEPSRNGTGIRKVTRAHVDARWDELEAVIKKRARLDPPTAAQRRRAAEICAGAGAAGFCDAPTVRARAVDVPRWSPLPGLGIALLVVLVVLLLALGGCVSDADRKLLDTGVAVNMGDAADESLPREAREIALDNADAFAALRYSLTGDELPPATRERLEAHRRTLQGATPAADSAPVTTEGR